MRLPEWQGPGPATPLFMPRPDADAMAFADRLADGYAVLPGWAQTAVQVAVVVLVGWVVLKILDRYLDKVLRRSRHVDATLRSFLVRTTSIGGGVLVAAWALAVAGVDLAALLGGLAIGGFVLGFALKDALGNLAAGVMLLLYRPFNVDDVATIGGETGLVTALGMAMTTLRTGDGRVVTVPNGKVLGGTLVNHTREPKRRADVRVGIGYGDDIDAAVRAILAAVREDPRVLPDPEPSVWISGLDADSVGLVVRPWVATADFWQAQADLHGTVKRAVESAGCTIPYPQRDVHLHQVGA